MTDAMAMALLRLLITMARHLARGGRSRALEASADEAERICNERARIS